MKFNFQGGPWWLLGLRVGGFYADLSICMGGVLLFANLRGFKFYLSRKGYRRVS